MKHVVQAMREEQSLHNYASRANLTSINSFDSNSATTGGELRAYWSDVTERSKFEKNIAVFGGEIH